jgi:hypothetical protein
MITTNPTISIQQTQKPVFATAKPKYQQLMQNNNNYRSYDKISGLISTNKNIILVDGQFYNKLSYEYFCKDYLQDKKIVPATGDLAYGTGRSRTRFLQFVPGFSEEESKFRSEIQNSNLPTQSTYTVDFLNTQFVCPHYTTFDYSEDIRKLENPELFNSRVLAYIKNQGLDPTNLNQDDLHRLEQEYAASYDSSYEPKTEEAKQFKAWLDQHPKYSPLLSSGHKQIDIDLRVGRACKGGLEYTLENGNAIYFVLDNLDLNKIIDDCKNESTDRKFTGKEFKWLYRNRHKDTVKSHVQFIENGQHAPAPWSDPEKKEIFSLFEKNYAEYRSNK